MDAQKVHCRSTCVPAPTEVVRFWTLSPGDALQMPQATHYQSKSHAMVGPLPRGGYKRSLAIGQQCLPYHYDDAT